MKRIFCLMLCASTVFGNANACDVCGCSASSQYLGLLPDIRWNFLGFQYEHYYFKSNYPALFDNQPNERAQQYYNTLQLWGRYNIGKRLQVLGFVPYKINVHEGDTSIKSSGMGDVSLLANYAFVKPGIGSEWQHQLLAGGGIKLPAGSYKGINELDREGLPNTQSGTGSWDFLINANYTIRRKNIGANIDAAYTITTANKYDYKYGNRISSGLLIFYAANNKTGITLLPQLGIRYEYALHDYDNYPKKWLNEETGGYMCFATGGLQIYYKKIGFRVMLQLPLSQHYSAGYVTTRYKFDTGFFLLL